MGSENEDEGGGRAGGGWWGVFAMYVYLKNAI